MDRLCRLHLLWDLSPLWPPCPLASWRIHALLAGLPESAPAAGSLRNIKESRRRPHEKQRHWALDSWFPLDRFFLQHISHNFDLGALRIVRIRREVEQLGILARARSVE